MSLSLVTVIPAFAIVLLAGVASGVTGFGFALVAVPLLLMLLPAKMVVALIVLMAIFTKIPILYDCRRSIDLRRIWPLVIAGVTGIPLGAFLLVIADVQTLKVAIGVIITLFAVAFLLGLRFQVRNEKLAFVPVGIVSGILNGGTGMSGPPVVLFFNNQRADKQSFRGNLTLYFAVLNLATIPAHMMGGLITPAVLQQALILLPALILGTLAGIRLSRYIPEAAFRRLTLAVVTITGLLSVASGLGFW